MRIKVSVQCVTAARNRHCHHFVRQWIVFFDDIYSDLVRGIPEAVAGIWVLYFLSLILPVACFIIKII